MAACVVGPPCKVPVADTAPAKDAGAIFVSDAAVSSAVRPLLSSQKKRGQTTPRCNQPDPPAVAVNVAVLLPITAAKREALNARDSCDAKTSKHP